MTLGFFALFVIFLVGFTIVYFATDKLVDCLFGDSHKEKK